MASGVGRKAIYCPLCSSEKTARDDRFGVQRVHLLPAAQVLIRPHPDPTEVDDHLVVSVAVQIAGRDAFGREGVQLPQVVPFCRTHTPTEAPKSITRSVTPLPSRSPPASRVASRGLSSDQPPRFDSSTRRSPGRP